MERKNKNKIMKREREREGGKRVKKKARGMKNILNLKKRKSFFI